MPRYILVPLVAIVVALLGAYALAPVIWLTRSERALALRRTSNRTLLSWWCVAVVPWVIAVIAIHHYQHVSVSVNGVIELIATIVLVLLLISALVSLPLSVIALSVICKLDRHALESVSPVSPVSPVSLPSDNVDVFEP